MLEQHQDSGADVTLATLPIEPDEVSAFRRGGGRSQRRGHRLSGEAEADRICARPSIRTWFDASMGIYLFNTDVLHPGADEGRRRPEFAATTSGTTSCPSMLGRLQGVRLQLRRREQARKRSTGATWGRSTPTTKPTWTWSRCRRSSTSTTALADPHAHAAVSAGEVCLRRAGPHRHALNSIVSTGCIVSGGVVRNSVLSHDVRVNSYAEVETSILSHTSISAGTAASARPSSIATCTFRRARDRLRHRSGPAEVSCHRHRHHGCHARLFPVREPGDGRLLHVGIAHFAMSSESLSRPSGSPAFRKLLLLLWICFVVRGCFYSSCCPRGRAMMSPTTSHLSST